MSQKRPGGQRPETAIRNTPALETRPRPALAKLLRLPRPFILLNIPKTGSTHTTQYVKQADLLSAASLFGMSRIFGLSHISRKWGWKILSKLKSGLPHGYMNFEEKHTPYSWLPERLRSLPAITVLRDPVSWCISNYVYKMRKDMTFFWSLLQLQNPEYKSFVQKYMDGKVSIDAWRNISLEGFWHFTWDIMRRWQTFNDSALAADSPIGACGCHTLLFLQREPWRVFAMPAEEAEEYFASGRGRQDLCQVHLLRHEQLQEELDSVMLEQLGYRREILDAAREFLDTIQELEPARLNVPPAERKERALQELEQKPWLREEILHGERIYLQYILPLAGAPQ